MFILNPDPYSLPTYRIGPFRTQDVGLNHLLPDSDTCDRELQRRFQDKSFTYTINGRQAINLALKHYRLEPDDVVTIFTTTQNFYISGCVTKEIERFCKWSREMTDRTRIIFVNHEFGYPFKKLVELKAYGLPIIEDCCTTYFSDDGITPVGAVGDFVAYSFPKFFPVQIGGLLVSNLNIGLPAEVMPRGELQYLKNVLSHYLPLGDEILQSRRSRYELLRHHLGTLSLHPRFESEPGVVPSVFMFRRGHVDIDLPALKKHLWDHGIQCSVFYGEDSFFIPAHQGLSDQDVLYFKEAILSFVARAKEQQC